MTKPTVPQRRHFASMRLLSGSGPVQRDILDRIERFGFASISIFPSDSGDTPGFTYTVGISYTWGYPEAIVFGLPGEVAQSIMWNYVRWREQDPLATVPTTTSTLMNMPSRVNTVDRSWHSAFAYCG